MTVDEFVDARVLPAYRPIVQALRKLMRDCAPNAAEIISYGIPACKGKRILVVISPTKKGITFAFSRGADFEDKTGLLEGGSHGRSDDAPPTGVSETSGTGRT